MGCRPLSIIYASPVPSSPATPLVHGGSGNRRAVVRAERSKAFAAMIRAVCARAGVTERELAEALYLDRKDAHAIMAGGKASAQELKDALDAFGERAA